MKTAIKICGLRRQEDIDCVNEARPDFAGFVIHVVKSPRNVTADMLAQLSGRLSADIVPVGVFVNESPETIAMLAGRGLIRAAQLHGQEDDNYIRRLRQMTDIFLIQAISVTGTDSVKMARQSPADAVLFDCGSGGTGKTFDWQLLDGVRHLEKPFFIAGGIGVNNMEAAIRRFCPFAVDLSSSVETDGFKDKAKISEAVALLRSINNEAKER